MTDQVLYTAHGRVLYIPVSIELAAKLGEDWSEPVQIRIDADTLVVRTLPEASNTDTERHEA